MWSGEQPPAGGRNPRRNNPFQRPGHRHHPPHQGGPAPWDAPTVTAGPPAGGGPGGRRTRVVAIVAAAAVVAVAAVTGAVLLGGGEDDRAEPDPAASSASASPSPAGPRDADGGPGATVPGWKAVVNPGLGVAFDVPASWQPQSPDWVTFVTEDDDPDDKPLVAMKAPAVLEERWCTADDDRDGSADHTPLASAGTRGNNGARNTGEIARTDSAQWVYGAFAQPDRRRITTGPVTSFTTASGITGSLATSRSSGVEKRGECDTDGKATTFAFKSADGDLVSWSFVGPTGVGDEVPDATVREIAATVREFTPSES